VVPLTLGWEDLPKAVSIHGTPIEERLVEPVPGVLLLCDGGWVLLDTGFNAALIRDPQLRRRFHGNPLFQPVLPGPGEPLEEALDEVGIAIDDIVCVGLSHLHNDHAGGLKHFAGKVPKVPVHAQRREVDYGLANHPDPERHAMFRVDYDDPAIDWRLADGDAEIAPGVEAVLSAGHTPGHQSFVVSLDESVGGGGLVFAFDAADLTENIEQELAVGGRVNATPEETIETIRRLKSIAAAKGFPLIPGHDPVAWPRLTIEMAERFGRAHGS
jgi:glyoxylase-like metal-dependent hydrolase (beta-lactamase superfamily II)